MKRVTFRDSGPPQTFPVETTHELIIHRLRPFELVGKVQQRTRAFFEKVYWLSDSSDGQAYNSSESR